MAFDIWLRTPSPTTVVPFEIVLSAPPPAFGLVAITPLNSNTLRAFFSSEPRHVSPLGSTDVTNRLNWTLNRTAGLGGVPVLEGVENAIAQPSAIVGFPGMWSVDIRTNQPVLLAATYQAILSTAVVSATGVYAIAAPWDRASCPGIVSTRDRARLQPASTRGGLDIHYDLFRGTFQLDPRRDIGLHGGTGYVKKRIIRRLITRKGGFFHLPDYGADLRVKELLRTTDLALIRDEVERQVRREEEVEAVTVELARPSQGVLVVSVRARTSLGGFELGIELDESGRVLLQ